MAILMYMAETTSFVVLQVSCTRANQKSFRRLMKKSRKAVIQYLGAVRKTAADARRKVLGAVFMPCHTA